MLDKDDGLIFPEERKVILLLIEKHVIERRDGDVLRTDIVLRANRLIELCDLPFMIEEGPKDSILVLAVRHEVHPPSLLLF